MTDGTPPAHAQCEAVAFAERLLNLLDQGRFTATYKYAVLLALIDLCQERSHHDGRAPGHIHTRDLAEKVVALYWPHTRSYVRQANSSVLQQNNRGQAEIVSRIARFRENSVGDATAPLTTARLAAPAGWQRLVAFVEWKLIEMPLPRLQQVGPTHKPFIYDIGWTSTITRTITEQPSFDRRLRLLGNAGEHLVTLAGLLRPLIQRHWTLTIARLNRSLLDDADLDEFLFGVARTALNPVRRDLHDLQDGRCFYCDATIRGRVEVDHFIPWARHPDNGLDNLVAADTRCNNSKRAFLASADHVQRWAPRFSTPPLAQALADIADARRWPREPDRTLSIARSIYLRLPTETPTWVSRYQFVEVDAVRIAAALHSTESS
jgi:5-methylcytosine-specific restriction endonuclease McrA